MECVGRTEMRDCRVVSGGEPEGEPAVSLSAGDWPGPRVANHSPHGRMCVWQSRGLHLPFLVAAHAGVGWRGPGVENTRALIPGGGFRELLSEEPCDCRGGSLLLSDACLTLTLGS